MTNAEIKNKIVKLLDGLQYEKILLFGSRARGENRADSDYDVIVTLKNEISRIDRFLLQSKIRKFFAQEKTDIDIIIKSARDFDYLKEKVGNAIFDANKEGIVI
ncbi:MAG: nucleotidyltransferase domain-containing protein [Bacteroidetes bacterium]|nr:nucleotidyltransferase domain-containing protein [Bacteroidota bacterium]